jgi:putative hydrolase of the HAD superfamily
MKPKVFVVDMDETLYDERQFVYGGFRAVAAYLARRLRADQTSIYRSMVRHLRRCGRERALDEALKRLGAYSKRNVRACLAVYRSHEPDLALYPDARRFFRRYRNWPVYVVTDGNPRVQRRKARALGLERLARKVMVACAYGRNRAKPSPYVFRLIGRLEKVDPPEIVHIGDDPHKDFLNLKPLGFQTVRMLRGRFKDVRLDRRHEAGHSVRSLDEL